MLTVTPFYAGLIALLFVILSARVITYRRSNQLSLGDEGDRSLLKRMRAQGNCAEYAPIGLLLLALIELQGAPDVAVHVLGLMLLTGRLLHGWAFSVSPPVMLGRVTGMFLTLCMIVLSALGLILHSLL